MVEILSIPLMKDENVYNIIKKIIELAEIELFSVDQINIAHRMSTNHHVPIITLFNRKLNQINFYIQKRKLQKLTTDQVLLDLEKTEQDFNDSLTPKNRLSLKKAEKNSKDKKVSV